MPIEFRCHRCERLLRTADETAGKHARCPSCGNIQQVPGGAEVQPAPSAPPAEAPAPEAANPQVSSPAPTPAPNVFADHDQVQSAPTTVPAMGGTATLHAHSKLQGPSVALIVLAILGLGTHGVMMLAAVVGLAQGEPEDEMVPLLILCLLNLPLSAFVLFGGIQLRRLHNHALCMAAAIAAMLPCGCCVFLGIPFGIWALIALSDPIARESFS